MKANNQKNSGINAILIVLVLISTSLYFFLVAVVGDIWNTAYKLTSYNYSLEITGFIAAVLYLLFPGIIVVFTYKKSKFKRVAILLGLLNILVAGLIFFMTAGPTPI